LVKWSETLVHETLLMPNNKIKKRLSGRLHHYSVKDLGEYERKCSYYAKLSAKKYFYYSKKANAIKLYVSPVFGFIKNYILYLGFLDGREGWDIAKTSLKNTYLKYLYLSKMKNAPAEKKKMSESLAVEYLS